MDRSKPPVPDRTDVRLALCASECVCVFLSLALYMYRSLALLKGILCLCFVYRFLCVDFLAELVLV